MSDLNLRQAVALLDSAERQLAAARALLGGTVQTPTPRAREEVLRDRGTSGDRCPRCGEEGKKQDVSPIDATVKTFMCGVCAYAYSTT